MHKILLAAALLLATTAHAQTIGVHLVSTHLHPELAHADGDPEPYNDINPGLYYRTAAGWQVGAYRNSHRQPTFYAGKAWTIGMGQNWDAGVMLAGATGYPAGSVVPMLAASVRYSFLRLTATPRIGSKASAVLHLSAEWSL
jgi:hypothetical protein